MKWIKSESTEIPETLENTPSTVYLRRNVKEVQRTNEMSDESITFYEYEEAALTKDEYTEYLQIAEAVNMRQIRADVDYINMYLDIPH